MTQLFNGLCLILMPGDTAIVRREIHRDIVHARNGLTEIVSHLLI
jgi:hypothetical protein